MLTRTQKQEQVADLKDKLARATGVFVADYRGLSVRAVNELRSKLRAPGTDFEYRVAKNTLVRRAIEGSQVAEFAQSFQGPTALALAFGDPVPLAKILVDYAKQHEVFELKAALVEGRALDRQEIATLATLPSLEGLRARLVGLLQAPATQVVRLVAAPGAQLARLVEARRRRLEEEGGSA